MVRKCMEIGLEFGLKDKIRQEIKEERIRLPKEIDLVFMHWLKDNGYALRSIGDYHRYIRRLVGVNPYINTQKIKSFLSQKNSLPKRSAVKAFLIFLEDTRNIKLPEFRFPRIKKETKALEVIGKENFQKILNQIRPEFRLYMSLMYYGGMRVSEVAAIKSDQFNWIDWVQDKSQFGELKITKTKRNKERIIPINPILMQQVFDFIPKHEDTRALTICYVFDIGKTKYSRYRIRKRRKGIPEEAIERRFITKIAHFFAVSFREASIKAIGRPLKTHMIRATRATDLEEDGMSPSEIRDLLGHDNLSTTSRYLASNPKKLKEKMRQIELKNPISYLQDKSP